ncbi:MAG TPA: outer membrane beta-barrel protein [Saprospiraceae bacterium]|nr:outer membrane beta-barrel protein [Saprospiraceae bacterium]
MKKLLLLSFVFAITLDIQAQNSIGLRLGVLLNKIHDCYGDDNEYRRQPAAMGGYCFFFQQFSPDWGIQAELGYSQRNTHLSRAGVSQNISSDYRLKQMELNLVGKFALDVTHPRLILVFGLATGYVLSGREYIYGWAVGNFSIDDYRNVNFDNFALKRFQIGPSFGLEIAQPLFGAGEVLLDSRFAYYPENDFHGCDHPNETRFSFSLGYRWNLKQKDYITK